MRGAGHSYRVSCNHKTAKKKAQTALTVFIKSDRSEFFYQKGGGEWRIAKILRQE